LSASVKTRSDLRIYFDAGRFDLPAGSFNNRSFLEAAEELHSEMEQDEIKHVFHIFNDGHEWANWRERMSEIVMYFFEADR
jgi:enterochelin esterase-like enzyme